MSRFTAAARWSALILVLLAVASAPASAQCLITGPDATCGTPVSLCAPGGPNEYDWTLPDGSHAATQCLETAVPGTYTLRYYDGFNGMWFGPCTHTLATAAAGTLACAIEGTLDGCVGDTLTLCGPAGAGSYAWSGPGGFTASDACARVTVAGTYTLSVRSASGCDVGGCEATVTLDPCGGTSLACPRPPSFFARACEPDTWRVPGLGAEQMAALAARIDERSAAFAWSDPAAGFCAALHGWDGLRASAGQQVVTVWANVCASELGLVPHRGRPIALDPATPVLVPFLYRGTVGEWLAMADAKLVALASRRPRDGDVRAAYAALVTVGWCIDHGFGIGPTCATPRGCALAASGVPADLAVDGETLASALAEPAAPSLWLGHPSPNPARGAMTLEYAIGGAGALPVRIVVMDVAGRRVSTLVDGPVAPGPHVAHWDGRDLDGTPARGGMYFVVAHLGDQRLETRVTLLR